MQAKSFRQICQYRRRPNSGRRDHAPFSQEQLVWRLTVQNLQRCEIIALLREISHKLDSLIGARSDADIERERTR